MNGNPHWGLGFSYIHWDIMNRFSPSHAQQTESPRQTLCLHAALKYIRFNTHDTSCSAPMLQDQPHAQGCCMYSAYVVSLMCPSIKEDSCARLEKNAYLILPESEIGDQHFQSHEQCTDTISQNTLRQNRQAQNLLIYSDSNATNDKDVFLHINDS